MSGLVSPCQQRFGRYGHEFRCTLEQGHAGPHHYYGTIPTPDPAPVTHLTPKLASGLATVRPRP